MPRIVIDSNVYVSAVVFGGTPRIVLELGLTGAFAMIVSSEIQAEVRQTLERKFHYETERISQIDSMIWLNSELVVPVRKVKASRDAKDDHILAAAIDGKADFILTGDSDLLSLHPFNGIEILNPAALLARLMSEKQQQRRS